MRVLVTLFLILVAIPTFGQTIARSPIDVDLKIRTYLEPDNGVYVGQLARLWIEISSSHRFARAPHYPDLQMNGAIVIMPDQFGSNFTQSVQGNTRIGQRQRYAIIPQREGTLVISAVNVNFTVMIDGKESRQINVKTKPVELSAIFPPGTKYLGGILTTENLTITESYDRETEKLRVGDTLTRTVTLHGENTFALALPPTEFVTVEGARVYSAQPILSDQTNRGQYSGTRIDSGSYVLEQAKEISLPEISVRWWNPETKTLEEAIMPAVSFLVEANPDFQTHTGIQTGKTSLMQRLKRGAFKFFVWLKDNIIWLTMTAICFYIFVLIWKRFSPVFAQSWKSWRGRVRTSEAHYFSEFRRACLINNESDITRTFWVWIDSRYPGTQTSTLNIVDIRNYDANMFNYFGKHEKQHYGEQKKNKY
jgi:hypothetical protein